MVAFAPTSCDELPRHIPRPLLKNVFRAAGVLSVCTLLFIFLGGDVAGVISHHVFVDGNSVVWKGSADGVPTVHVLFRMFWMK